jgi:hypothetical protein
MNFFLKVLLSASFFLIVLSAYAEDTTACFPPCRAGYLCFHGKCIEQCNPPCPAATKCNSNSECVPIERPAAPTSLDKKYRKHTGFYLSFNGGYDFGVNATTKFPDSSTVHDYTFSGSGIQFGFSIGAAVKENLVLFADLISFTDITGPAIKINDSVPFSTNDNLSVDNYVIGAGIMYYFMPYNVFISASIGPSFTDVSDNSCDYYSGIGFGAEIRAGKEWWVSRRWALGVVALYQFTIQNSGDIFRLSGRMHSSMGGISFSATFN